MKKAKKAVSKKSHHTSKRSSWRHHTGNDVYWYGIHIHHIALGVASVGSLVLLILVSRM